MAVVSPHVLVIDACDVGRLYVPHLLRQFNVRVTAVRGVEEALSFLDQENDVNLIVANYHTERLSGYDLLMKVKESSKLKHLPVVITSVVDKPDLIKKCMEGGAKGFYPVPLRFDDVPRLLSFI